MFIKSINEAALLVGLILLPAFCVIAQSSPEGFKSQEVSETDGIPVLVKHLPDWESVRHKAIITNNTSDLKKEIGQHPLLDLIDLSGGAEAVTAPYPAGKLLIVEFTNPQASIFTDAQVTQKLSESPAVAYKRIGNYNVFVFDTADQSAAVRLIDQVRYEKNIQWLGEDPFLLKKLERYFVTTTRDIFISTTIVIVGGIGTAILTGLLAGFFYFRFQEQKRAGRRAFSDAGGLTRLNLDDLSE